MWPARFSWWRPVLCGIFVSGALAHAALRVVGSDLLGDELMREIVAHAGEAGPGATPAFDGSRPGLEELRLGRADLALVVLPAEEVSSLDAVAAVPLGYFALSLAVPAECPLAEISFAQLARAFGAEPDPSPASWGELSASGAWETAPVVVLVPPVANSFAVDYFRHLVLGDRELRPAAHGFTTPAELALEFSGEAKPIALLAQPRQCPAGARLVAVTRATGRRGCLPTAEHLHAGDYPLAVPLHVAFPRARATALTPVLRFLLSENSAGVLERAGIVPLPPAAREQELKKLGAP